MGATDKPIKFIAKPLAPTELQEAPRWLIKGILPEGFLSLLKGLPGSFKTFEAVSWALCLATGIPWCGRRAKRCKVLYIAADDPDGPRMRAQAWAKHHRIPPETIDAVMFDQIVNFHSDAEVATAITDIKRQGLKPDFVIWDTLFHSTVGADLTLPKDVLPIAQRMRDFMKAIGACSGLILHHTPKDGKGVWGSISITATVDVIMDSEAKGPDTATLTCERMRRARAFDPLDIKLASIQIETLPDDEGVALVDQLVVASGEPAKSSAKADPKAKLVSLAWKVLFAVYPARLNWSAWHSATKTANNDKLGNSDFSDAVKELVAPKVGEARVEKDSDGGFRVVFGTDAGWAPEGPPKAKAAPPPTPYSGSKGSGVTEWGAGTPSENSGVKRSDSTEGRNEEKSVEKDKRELTTTAESGASESQADALVQAALKQTMDGKRKT